MGPAVEIQGSGVENREKVRVALERFRRNGLALPDLTIRFASSGEACRGHDGLFRKTMRVSWEVVVCVDLPYVLTHELAHAWVAASLDDDDKAAYVAFRGLEVWSDPSVPWMQRGTEDAAFVLQQTLMFPGDTASDRWIERYAARDYLLELAGVSKAGDRAHRLDPIAPTPAQ